MLPCWLIDFKREIFVFKRFPGQLLRKGPSNTADAYHLVSYHLVTREDL